MIVNLRYLREKNGLSQSQLAKGLGVTQQTVNKYENHTTEPDIATLVRIARFFNTSVDFLVGNTSIERKYEEVCRYDLNDGEQKVMEGFRETTESGRDIIMAMLKELNKHNHKNSL